MKYLNRNERQVMELLWNSRKPLTSLELTDLLNGAMSVSYLHKVLTALRAEGMIGIRGVDMEIRRPAKKFGPLVSKEDYVAALIQDQGLGDVSLARIGAALVRKVTKETDEERKELIAALEKMIEDYEKEGE